MKLAIAVIGIIAAALLVACSDSSDSLTLEEYFAEFQSIDDALGARFGAVVDQFPEDGDDADLPFAKDLFAEIAVMYGDAVDSYGELEAPSDVQNEHDDFVVTGEDFVSAWDEAVEVIAEAETVAELEALIDGGGVESIIRPPEMVFDEACFALVDVGDANGIFVDVSCLDRR